MIKWFTSNPAGSVTCLPMVLSTFSHYSLVHLGCNMVALHSFMGTAVHELGKKQFLGVYLSAGVFSSLASMLYKVASRSAGSHSLGASGAIMAVLGMFGTIHPDATLQIIFLPMVTFTAPFPQVLCQNSKGSTGWKQWTLLGDGRCHHQWPADQGQCGK